MGLAMTRSETKVPVPACCNPPPVPRPNLHVVDRYGIYKCASKSKQNHVYTTHLGPFVDSLLSRAVTYHTQATACTEGGRCE